MPEREAEAVPRASTSHTTQALNMDTADPAEDPDPVSLTDQAEVADGDGPETEEAWAVAAPAAGKATLKLPGILK